MGSRAAIAFDKLLNLNLQKTELVEFSAEGEIASAGIKHYDNVGSVNIWRIRYCKKAPKLEVINVDPPKRSCLGDSSSDNNNSAEKNRSFPKSFAERGAA